MKVKKEMLLMDYLLLSYNRKNAKNLLKYKQVYVNNQQISQFDYLLHENDQVEIKKENTSSLEILYEDQEFVVINKPSGLLSMSEGKEKEKTAYHYVSEYLKKQDIDINKRWGDNFIKKRPPQIFGPFRVLFVVLNGCRYGFLHLCFGKYSSGDLRSLAMPSRTADW